ncbi:hypothetical protein RB653_000978 [Dictyostelium firmibasis]|uniref:Uncharacterized protein n=1 Tax=Dictyostelium firmibasis TaxID=79012 RepID=A0AAN7YUU4_9MYCE
MKYRRRDEPNSEYQYTHGKNSSDEEDEEIINDTAMPPLNNEEKYFLKRVFPFLPSRTSSSASKLIFSLILDLIGFFTQIIPVFGFAFWPSISTYLIFKVYGSGLHLCVSFLEETITLLIKLTNIIKIPGLGFIPTATCCWANEKYNVIPKVNRYLPTRYIKMVKTFISTFKKVAIAIALVVVYKVISYFSPYLPFFGGSKNHQASY